MEGVTTAIVGFIFVCVVFPHLVKNKPQWYAALGGVVLILLVSALTRVIRNEAFLNLAAFLVLLFQIGAILLLVLSCGGLTARELAGEMRHAFEVIRRGGEEKEIIIPLTGDQPRPRRDVATDDIGPIARRPIARPGGEGERIPLE